MGWHGWQVFVYTKSLGFSPKCRCQDHLHEARGICISNEVGADPLLPSPYMIACFILPFSITAEFSSTAYSSMAPASEFCVFLEKAVLKELT